MPGPSLQASWRKAGPASLQPRPTAWGFEAAPQRGDGTQCGPPDRSATEPSTLFLRGRRGPAAGAQSAQVRPRPRVPARPPSPSSLAPRRDPNAGPRTQPLRPDGSVATGQEAGRLLGCPRCGALAAELHLGPTASPALSQPGPCRSSPAVPRPDLPSVGHALDTPLAWALPLGRWRRVALSPSIKDMLPGDAAGRHSDLPIKSAPLRWGRARPAPYVTAPRASCHSKKLQSLGRLGREQTGSQPPLDVTCASHHGDPPRGLCGSLGSQ